MTRYDDVKTVAPSELLSAPYDTAQLDAIRTIVAKSIESACGTYRYSDRLVEIDSGQRFAIAGNVAYEILRDRFLESDEEPGTTIEYVPLLHEGRMQLRNGRLCYLVRLHRPRGISCWMSCHPPTGWLLINELTLPADVLRNKLDDEWNANDTELNFF